MEKQNSKENRLDYVRISYHDLADVKRKIKQGQVLINPDVLRDADLCFGWKQKDILYAYSKLKPKDFYKSDHSKFKKLRIVDTYKAKIKGMDIYTHFYVDVLGVVINSFHKP